MQKTGDEPVLFKGADTGYCLCDFWRWGFSDLLENKLRGSYAEFIVTTALGIDTSDVTSFVRGYNLRMDKFGIVIEGRCSCGYIQQYHQGGQR